MKILFNKTVDNVFDLSFSGRVNIAQQLDSRYPLTIARYNENVGQNKVILSKIWIALNFAESMNCL